MNIIPHVKSMELTHILCVRCGFWRFLPFKACFAITVIPVIRGLITGLTVVNIYEILKSLRKESFPIVTH